MNNYFPYRFKFAFGLIACTVFLAALFAGNLFIGILSVNLDPLLHSFSMENIAPFFIQLRFYRAITAVCCGGMLALGSAVLQGLTRNNMVAPDLSGMTSFGCLLIIACGLFFPSIAIGNIPLGILGALVGFLLCFFLAPNSSDQQNHRFVLTGLILSFTATAFIQLLLLSAPKQMDDYLYFLTGSLYAINGKVAMSVSFIASFLIPVTFLLGKRFILFSFDEESRKSLGMLTKPYQISCFMVASLLIGSSIIGVGNMGFLGIVAPNLARLFIGNRPTYLFPLSFLTGASLYLLADIIGRTIISPAEIPAGIMTNIISSPLFLYILFRYNRGQHGWN